MHIFHKAMFAILCASFSAPVFADDFVSTVEQNFPYHEVDESYGVASIRAGRCRQGTPFSMSLQRSQTSTNLDVASQVHEKLRTLGANAFVIIDIKEDTRVTSIMVTPYTCALR